MGMLPLFLSAVQREHDVQESILFMAKQSGNIDPDVSEIHVSSVVVDVRNSPLPQHTHTQTTLDQVDMEDDMKMLVSDEIKRFRESYKVCFSP